MAIILIFTLEPSNNIDWCVCYLNATAKSRMKTEYNKIFI